MKAIDRDCKNCVKRKTTFCPNSKLCYDNLSLPYFQDRIMLLKENEELKEQLKEEIRSHEYDERVVEQHCDFVDKHYAQQKEFISYLEDEMKNVTNTIDLLSDTNSCRIPKLKVKIQIYKDILEKYKEIIGV